MAATHFQPLIEEEHWISLRGGLMRKDVAHVPVHAVQWGERRLRLLKLRARDTDLAKLITGKPACERPFAGLHVFRHLHEAINKAGLVTAVALAEEDDAGFREDLGVDNEPFAKRQCIRRRGLDFIAIVVHRTPGQPLEGTQDLIFENLKDLSMDIGEQLENLTRLIKAVLAERADPGLVSSVSPRA